MSQDPTDPGRLTQRSSARWTVGVRGAGTGVGKRGTELGLGIGIEAGHATLGRIGFEGQYDYGALGPVTNLASRLSTQAAAGQIMIGQRAF